MFDIYKKGVKVLAEGDFTNPTCTGEKNLSVVKNT